MNLQKELRHKSEDINDLVLLDVVRALRRRVRRVSHDYDIPYIAGYSVDGKTIFIDRHLPRTIRSSSSRVKGKNVQAWFGHVTPAEGGPTYGLVAMSLLLPSASRQSGRQNARR